MNEFWKIRSNQSFDNPIQYNNLTMDVDEAIQKHSIEAQLISHKLGGSFYPSILDLGSGNGQWYSLLEPLCDQYHCVDPYIAPSLDILSNSKVFYHNDE